MPATRPMFSMLSVAIMPCLFLAAEARAQKAAGPSRVVVRKSGVQLADAETEVKVLGMELKWPTRRWDDDRPVDAGGSNRSEQRGKRHYCGR